MSADALDGQAKLRSLAFVFLTSLLSDNNGLSARLCCVILLAHSLFLLGAAAFWLDLLKKKAVIGHFLTQLKQRDSVLRCVCLRTQSNEVPRSRPFQCFSFECHREAVLDRQLRNYDQILNYESMMAFLIKGTVPLLHRYEVCIADSTRGWVWHSC